MSENRFDKILPKYPWPPTKNDVQKWRRSMSAYAYMKGVGVAIELALVDTSLMHPKTHTLVGQFYGLVMIAIDGEEHLLDALRAEFGADAVEIYGSGAPSRVPSTATNATRLHHVVGGRDVFSRADVLVGPHGAAFCNALFARGHVGV